MDVISQPTIDPATTMGTVSLTVADLDSGRRFYERVLGLRAAELDNGRLGFTAGGNPLVELRADSSAGPLDRSAPGLFHFAILMPDRRSLARALAGIAQARWPLDGASDHLVSEALYLSDPEGNGIEVYADRPSEEWRRQNGELAMATLPLDLDNLIGELDSAPEPGIHPPKSTRIGHVHLQVADLETAEEFYAGVLGFDVTVRGYPGALFVSAGGYHHHLGLNTWNTRKGHARAPGAVGLDRFEIVVPDQAELERLAAQVSRARIAIEPDDHGWMTTDPSGTRLLLRAA